MGVACGRQPWDRGQPAAPDMAYAFKENGMPRGGPCPSSPGRPSDGLFRLVYHHIGIFIESCLTPER